VDLGAAISWPTRDPRWFAKCLLIGLIGLIPILGGIAVFGWMYATLDNLRAGRAELAEAGLPQLERGARLFVVQLVYGAISALLFALLVVPSVLVAIGRGSGGALVAVPLVLLGQALLLAYQLAFYFVFVPIILAVDRGGIGAGLDLPALWRAIRPRLPDTLLAGLMAFVALLLGSLGVFLCLVGIIFTIPYGYAILAAVVHGYERDSARLPAV
jgi:hypothetical protein